MREIIKMLLEHYGINQIEFSDKVGLSKGMVSLLMSGRREFTSVTISKILSAFPNVNYDWLVNGKGGMLTTKNDSLQKPEQTSFDFSVNSQSNNYSSNVNSENGVNKSNSIQTDNDITENNDVVSEPIHVSSIAESLSKINQKKTSRIVIFYTDGTFSEYKPDLSSF